MPQTIEGSSEDEGDEPFMVNKDMEASPSIPPAEFHDPDNVTSFAGVEDVNDELQLKQRPHFSQNGSIIYCIMPESTLTNANPW